MTDDWKKSRSFYAALTLARDGDETERHGALNYQLDQRWPAYERFWQFHVAPATERPKSIAIREGVSELVRDLILANYQTFCWVVSACDFTAMLQTDVGYIRTDDWRRLLSFHSKAIEEFSNLAASVERLLVRLGMPPLPMPSERHEWRSLVDNHQAYQAYLASLDRASVKWVSVDECQVATVMPQESVLTSCHLGPAVDAPAALHHRPLVDAVRDHLDKLICLLDLGLDQVFGELEQAHNRTYHQLWGWYRG